MRILDFIVSKQTIERDPNCDFSGIVSKSRGYLYARFRFSPDWTGTVKAVVFSNRGKEEGVPLVNNMCEIPAEIAAYRALHTNYPNTTVLNDSGAHMVVTYTADTKRYIDNKIAALGGG